MEDLGMRRMELTGGIGRSDNLNTSIRLDGVCLDGRG